MATATLERLKRTLYEADNVNEFSYPKRCRPLTPVSPNTKGPLYHRSKLKVDAKSPFAFKADVAAAAAAPAAGADFDKFLAPFKRRRRDFGGRGRGTPGAAVGAAGSAGDAEGGAAEAPMMADGDGIGAMSRMHRHEMAGPAHVPMEPSDAAAMPSPSKEEPIMFTLSQVKAIMQSALDEQEAELTRKYDKILYEKLVEQYNDFTKFNLDHIHSRFRKDEECPYIN